MRGIVLFAHGSTVVSANEAVHSVSTSLAERMGVPVATAFLECSPPTLADAVEKLVSLGVREITVVPYFLTMGIHLQRDLPRIVNEIRDIYEGVGIHIAGPLDGHPALLEILVDRCTKNDPEAVNARKAD